MGRQTSLQELACSRNKTRAFPRNPPSCSKRHPNTARTDGERRAFQRAAGFPSKIHGACSQGPQAPSWVSSHQARRYLGEHYASDRAHRVVTDWTFTNIIAGSDSVGAVMTTMMFHLLQNSNSMLKLQTELRSANLTRPHARLSEIQSLPYLDACMWEAIRLHPAFALPLERVVPEGGISIGKYYLPAGTWVGGNPYVVNRHKKTFGADAEFWRPERWLEGDEKYKTKLQQSNLTVSNLLLCVCLLASSVPSHTHPRI